MSVTVYTSPSCQPCKALKRWLDRKGVTYTIKDVQVDPGAREEAEATGYTATPITVIERGHGRVMVQGLNLAAIGTALGEVAA